MAKDGQGQVPTAKSSRGSVRPEALQSTGAKALPPEVRWTADLSSEGDGPKIGPKVKGGPEGHSDQNDPKPRPRAGSATLRDCKCRRNTFMVREHCTKFVRKFL